MAKNFQLFYQTTLKLKDTLEINPQLVREIKGKITGRNIFITSLISMLMQLSVIVFYLGQFPDINRDIRYSFSTNQYSRYCTGLRRVGISPAQYACNNKLGIWEINWHLFWHDIFIFFSTISIFILLIVGTYMIIADLVKEEKTGTINFIRLSPQSASSILLGKILGVPILVYFFIASILPLHLISGIKGNIPWYLILSFDIIVLASCAFFYSFSLCLSLIKLGKFKLNPWVATFFISWFICITTKIFFDSPYLDNSLKEWSYLFNPLLALTYTYTKDIPSYFIDYKDLNSLGSLLFYGQALWKQAITGMGFILLHFSLGTYWFWQSATRLFHNPTSTIFSKKQSYWITGWFVAITLGFTLQNGGKFTIFENFIMLQLLLSVMFLGLIAALSPHRQILSDWARYRHQLSKDGKELVFGEKSPSTIAIAINALIATIIILIGATFFLFPEEIATTMWGVILTMGMILFYAVMIQWMLLMKNHKRVLWTSITISLLIIIPPILFLTAEATVQESPLVWLFSFLPAIAIKYASTSALLLGVLGQLLAITLVSWQLINKLRQVGRSQTQQLLDNHTT